jgi:hypothetical protein
LISFLGAAMVMAVAARADAQLVPLDTQLSPVEQLAGTTAGTVEAILTADLLQPGSLTQTLFKPSKMTVTGRLVDYRCLLLFGADATPGSKYSDCVFNGVPKGDRVALVTSTGVVYFLTGTYTQAGNGQIKRYIDATVSVSGIVSQVDAAATLAPAEATPTDTRRNPVRTGEVKEETTRRGDYREGDPKKLWWFFMDATSASVVK